MYLLLMPNDTTLNSGCTRERSETYGGGPTKRISVAKRISVDLFFTCGKNGKRNLRGCGYFEWGDRNIVTRPLCHHGTICRVDGKPGERPFFGCTRKDDGCGYFEWGDPPNEDPASKKRRLERLSRLSKEERNNPWLSY